VVELRPYQTDCVTGVHAVWALSRRRIPLVVLPTGGGKTVVAEKLLEPAKRGLALVHTRTLLRQTRRRIKNKNVAVHTIQSLIGKGPEAERLRKLLAGADIVFIDEAHHIVSDEWVAVMTLFTDALIFGVTATPKRADGTPLGDVFTDLISPVNYSDLLELNRRDPTQGLVQCKVWRSDIDRKTQKKHKLKPDGVEAYFEKGGIDEDGNKRPGIYFGPSVKDCEARCAEFNVRGVRSAIVTGHTKDNERTNRNGTGIFDRYERGELDMLLSPMALAEGFDLPRAEVCILCRAGDGLAAYLQMCGRVLRPYWRPMGADGPINFRNKTQALLIDCVNASEKHWCPTDDRVYSLTGKGIQQLQEALEDEEAQADAKRKEAVRLEYELIRSGYVLVSNELLSRWRVLIARELNQSLVRGFARQEFRNETGVTLPMFMKSKFAGRCVHCAKRFPAETLIFWHRDDYMARSLTWHEQCYFESLPEKQLDECKATILPQAAQ
jgi:superfamily II DNA or RNA helicase